MNVKINIFLSFCLVCGQINAQWPKPLPGKGEQLTIVMIKDWMFKNGEIPDANDVFNLKELIELSHLKNKTGPFSISAFWNYSIEDFTKNAKAQQRNEIEGVQRDNQTDTLLTKVEIKNPLIATFYLHNTIASMLVYPNPFKTYLHINLIIPFSQMRNVTVYLLNAEGKRIRHVFVGKVMYGKENQISVDGTQIINGLYYIEVIGNNGQRIVAKVIKQ